MYVIISVKDSTSDGASRITSNLGVNSNEFRLGNKVFEVIECLVQIELQEIRL